MKRFILVLFAVVTLGFPIATFAQVPGSPFGGFVNFSIPCTCSGTLWVYFTPLYLSNVPITGPLVYSPFSTILFAQYAIGVPSTWELGGYIPGVQACWIVCGPACCPLPSLGLMTKVGTGL